MVNQPAPHPRVFTQTLVNVCVAWFALTLALAALVWYLDTSHFKPAVLISVLSGLIAIVALIPGLVSEWMSVNSHRTGDQSKVNLNYIGLVFGGVMLRLVATVALFVLCRYEMAGSVAWVAALTIGWYVVLTSVEVASLALKLPPTDKNQIDQVGVAVSAISIGS